MSARPSVGFVGLGRMGGAMASRLLDQGYPVHGTTRTRERAAPLLSAGMRWCDTPRDVAGAATVVLTSIPDDDALAAVAGGPDGLLSGLGSGTTWADMSTVSPRTSRELAARVAEGGAAMLDAPVSGSVPLAKSGDLTILVGGSEESYRAVEPVLRDLGTPTLVGANGMGLAVKLAVNISLAVQMVAFSEGLLLVDSSGVDRDLALRAMTGSTIGSPMLKARAPLIANLPDEAWFDIGFMRKDIELALDAGGQLGIPLPTAERADEILRMASDLGYGHRDIAALFQVLSRMPAHAAGRESSGSSSR
jgi:3-hydroxyisobutyrate dehydrogenase-like beta-hydroxyacid dehydrogenase